MAESCAMPRVRKLPPCATTGVPATNASRVVMDAGKGKGSRRQCTAPERRRNDPRGSCAFSKRTLEEATSPYFLSSPKSVRSRDSKEVGVNNSPLPEDPSLGTERGSDSSALSSQCLTSSTETGSASRIRSNVLSKSGWNFPQCCRTP